MIILIALALSLPFPNSHGTYIYSGDEVALKNQNYDDRWLSCWLTEKGAGQDRCRLSTCPQTTMQRKEWLKCHDVVFRIYAAGRGSQQPIRWNDQIALKYRYDLGYWLSCSKVAERHWCTTRTCPGNNFDFLEEQKCGDELFWIYSSDRRGSCSTNVWKQNGCHGTPIESSDIVFLWVQGWNGADDDWLSGTDDGIKTSAKPGNSINNNDVGRALSEAWQILKR